MKAPSHLTKPTAEWWNSVINEYELEEHHLKILTLAAETWDRCQQARRAIAKHGMTFNDRFGQPRQRPEIAVERDCRISFARLIRELDLDMAAPDSRAPSLGSNKG